MTFPSASAAACSTTSRTRHETDWGRGEISSQYVSRRGDPSTGRYELDTTGRNQAATLFHMNRTYDIRHLLPAVTAPTLVIHTEDNRSVPAAHAEYIAASIPDARLVLIPGSDHFFLKNCGTEVVDEVEELTTGRRTIFTDRIRATMLFTDIVGSTALAASIGDEEWDRKIGEHNELLRRLVVLNGGEECKHTGDGFFFVFEDTPDAVRFALAAVTAVEPLGLELCAGAHVGDVTRMDESDLSGVAVHLARRLCERAEGGHVLVSEDVRRLCKGSGLVFEGRGRASFKGFQDRWQTYEVLTEEAVSTDLLDM